MKKWELAVSGCATLVIFWGGVLISHGVQRTDLNAEFQKINHRYFADELCGVRVEYAVLEQNDGETRKYPDGDFSVLVDTRADVQRTLSHEACHVAIPWDDENRGHGTSFQNCMLKFPPSLR
jgi:hypothetical protein